MSQGRHYKAFDMLARIPVSPNEISKYSLFGNKSYSNLPSDALLCEDEGQISWLSQKAKDEYLIKHGYTKATS